MNIYSFYQLQEAVVAAIAVVLSAYQIINALKREEASNGENKKRKK